MHVLLCHRRWLIRVPATARSEAQGEHCLVRERRGMQSMSKRGMRGPSGQCVHGTAWLKSTRCAAQAVPF
eukprot:11557939-Alexandrium_andersonii.AAC.1